MAWKFLFLPPAYFSEDAQKEILHANFATMNRVFNPFWGNLIAKFPTLNPNLSQRDSDPGIVIARLVARAIDLRSWTPFLGFVPTWLPDGPQNFIEQGASRMSGNLYSTILSTDDEFNAKLSFRVADWMVRDNHGADREKPLGSVLRLMMYPGGRWDRIAPFNHADRPVDAVPPVLHNAGTSWNRSSSSPRRSTRCSIRICSCRRTWRRRRSPSKAPCPIRPLSTS
ncbi:MAG: hypothetical protein QM736_22570 [Vicinamibacterales bacterium]